jgi:hypothetical protein
VVLDQDTILDREWTASRSAPQVVEFLSWLEDHKDVPTQERHGASDQLRAQSWRHAHPIPRSNFPGRLTPTVPELSQPFPDIPLSSSKEASGFCTADSRMNLI